MILLQFFALCVLLVLSAGATAFATNWETAVVATTDAKHVQEGGAEKDGNTFTIKAGGHDIWGEEDQFTFVYQEWSGDFEIILTVHELGRTNDWSKAGPMARQNLEPGSINVLAACRGLDDLITYQHRPTPNGASSSERLTPEGAPRPVTIRLTRVGDTFVGGWSKDGGKTWEKNFTRDGVTPTPAITFVMADPILIGIAVTAHEAGAITTAEVELVSSSFAVDAADKLATTWGNLKFHWK